MQMPAFPAALFAALVFTTAALAAPDAKIARAFRAKCASCHGAEGKGDTEQGKKLGIKDLGAAEFQKAASDAAIKKTISEGKKAPGKDEGMDGFKDQLSEEQIDGLVAFVRSLAR